MRHNRLVKTFSRQTGHRTAMFRNLVNSLVEHGRIKTTVQKAKQLRRHVEKAVSLGKEGSLHAQRLLMSRYPNKATVSTIMKEISPRFKDRNGGYTRILKLGRRPGDGAEMAIIEFVDYTLPDAPNASKGAKGTKAAKGGAAAKDSGEAAAAAPAKKKAAKKASAKKSASAKKKTVKKAAKKAKKKSSKK